MKTHTFKYIVFWLVLICTSLVSIYTNTNSPGSTKNQQASLEVCSTSNDGKLELCVLPKKASFKIGESLDIAFKIRNIQSDKQNNFPNIVDRSIMLPTHLMLHDNVTINLYDKNSQLVKFKGYDTIVDWEFGRDLDNKPLVFPVWLHPDEFWGSSSLLKVYRAKADKPGMYKACVTFYFDNRDGAYPKGVWRGTLQVNLPIKIDP